MTLFNLYHGDCLNVLRAMPTAEIDAVITDPPYITRAAMVNDRGKYGVSVTKNPTTSVGNPWGYPEGWIESIAERFEIQHWAVFCNHLSIADIAARLGSVAQIQCIFSWKRTNAPPMMRPIPKLDVEFIVWAKSPKANCGRMREYKSLVIEHPFPQAGCMATERLLKAGTKQAAHPCQKPLGVMRPLIERLGAQTILDPFCGTGTTGVACIEQGKHFVGIEKDAEYHRIALHRLEGAERERQLLETVHE